MSDVAKHARYLMQRARRDPMTRRTIGAICDHHGCADITELAEAEPDLLADLVEMFAEMDEDDAAMDNWAANWNPLEAPQI